MRQIIWSSEAYLDEEARAEYEAQQREFLKDEGFKVSDTEWAEVVNASLSDERSNLNKPVNGIIIAFADLGLWKGRRQAYRILGRKVRDIFLTAEENNEWYGDGFNIRGELSHHDGTHHILYTENRQLSRQASNDARALAELKKIFEIEGLLSRYGDLFKSLSDNSEDIKRYPVNDYSGLNSLRARLKGYKGIGNPFAPKSQESDDDSTDFIDVIFASDNLEDSTLVSGNDPALGLGQSSNGDSAESGNDLSVEEYLALITSGKKCVGSPILFFFNLGTSNLTDNSQLVNLDEIARVAKTYGLSIRVTGAADSATGTASINSGLGNDRADYIISELQKRGIAPSFITKINRGGIDTLTPNEANRHCKIELFLTAK